MSLVLDASMTLAWYFDDESTCATDAVLDQVAQWGAWVPSLWRLEVANAFQQATEAQAWTEILQLSDRFSLAIYDAAYLELAQRQKLALAILDGELQSAAKVLDIQLLGLPSDIITGF